jgi:hypothetical protein
MSVCLYDSDAGLVGDPLEKASFRAIGFAYSKGDVATSTKGLPKQQIRIHHRYHSLIYLTSIPFSVSKS